MDIQDMALIATADFYEMLSKQANDDSFFDKIRHAGLAGSALGVGMTVTGYRNKGLGHSIGEQIIADKRIAQGGKILKYSIPLTLTGLAGKYLF